MNKNIHKNSSNLPEADEVNQLFDETTQKIYACPDCTQCFTEEDDLRNHSESHNIKFSCKVIFILYKIKFDVICF